MNVPVAEHHFKHATPLGATGEMLYATVLYESDTPNMLELYVEDERGRRSPIRTINLANPQHARDVIRHYASNVKPLKDMRVRPDKFELELPARYYHQSERFQVSFTVEVSCPSAADAARQAWLHLRQRDTLPAADVSDSRGELVQVDLQRCGMGDWAGDLP